MTRRLLFGSAADLAVIPDPLPGDGGGNPDPDPGTPDPTWPGWPTTSDTTLQAIRPSGRLAGTGTASNTAERDYLASSLNAFIGPTASGSLYWDGVGPDYRTDLLLQPATYTGGGNTDWRAIVGTSATNRAVLASDADTGGVIHSFGSLYLENLHLTALTNSSMSAPKYPWHITGGQMCTAANCVFDLSQIHPDTIQGGSGIAGWVGADGVGGMTIIFYRCDFIPGPIANVLNIHGESGTQVEAMTLAFVDCTGLDGVEIYAPGDTTTSGDRNRMYIINTPVAGIGGGSNTDIYTDGAAPAMTGNAATITRDVTTWDTPTGGLSDLWAAHYYPSSIGDEPFDWEPTVPDAAPMAPVVGRTYITRIDPDVAMCITHSGFTATTAAGNYGIVHRAADSPYVRDEPVTAENMAGGSLAVGAGKNAWKHPYFYTRYPGDNGVWVKVAWTSSAVRVTGSAALPGITDCYYTDDGTTLVPVTAGTPHPVPFVRAT